MKELSDETPSMKSRSIAFAHKVPILKTQRFWDGLEMGEVYATKCRKCAKLYYPPQGDCAQCLSSDVEWVKLDKEATLETFTHQIHSPAGFKQYGTYIIALARATDGVRVMGWLEDVEPEDVKVGIKLVMSTKKLPDGFLVITFKPNKL